MHGPAAFWLCVALYLLVAKSSARFGFGWAGAVGFAFGIAVLCRPNVAIYGAATGLSYLWCRQWRLSPLPLLLSRLSLRLLMLVLR